MLNSGGFSSTDETPHIGIGAQSCTVLHRIETFTKFPSNRQSVRLMVKWQGNVDNVKVGMNVVAQYFSHNLFFDDPALNIAPEFLPRQTGPELPPPDNGGELG